MKKVSFWTNQFGVKMEKIQRKEDLVEMGSKAAIWSYDKSKWVKQKTRKMLARMVVEVGTHTLDQGSIPSKFLKLEQIVESMAAKLNKAHVINALRV